MGLIAQLLIMLGGQKAKQRGNLSRNDRTNVEQVPLPASGKKYIFAALLISIPG